MFVLEFLALVAGGYVSSSKFQVNVEYLRSENCSYL
jgi:hypothetical protein